MDRRQLKLQGGPLDGYIIDPPEDGADRIRVVIKDRPKEVADRPVAVYVVGPGATSIYRVYVFLAWDRRRRRGKLTRVA